MKSSDFEVCFQNLTFGSEIKFLMDTGADITCIPHDIIPSNCQNLGRSNLSVFGPNENKL